MFEFSKTSLASLVSSDQTVCKMADNGSSNSSGKASAAFWHNGEKGILFSWNRKEGVRLIILGTFFKIKALKFLL